MHTFCLQAKCELQTTCNNHVIQSASIEIYQDLSLLLKKEVNSRLSFFKRKTSCLSTETWITFWTTPLVFSNVHLNMAYIQEILIISSSFWSAAISQSLKSNLQVAQNKKKWL